MMETEYPGFYKCVDNSFLHEGKLTVPKDFCKNFEVKVPDRCHLETSFGSWLVGLKRNSGEFFFKKGWMKFVVGNGLKLGEHVVFEYSGHANFDVEIYGQNHCSKSSKAKETHKLLDGESDDHDVISISSDSDTDSEMPLFSDNSLESEIKISVSSDSDSEMPLSNVNSLESEINISVSSDSDSEMPLSNVNSLESEIKSPRPAGALGLRKNLSKRVINLATIPVWKSLLQYEDVPHSCVQGTIAHTKELHEELIQAKQS